jgi:lambda repressor-like predicted transcriptional regulator
MNEIYGYASVLFAIEANEYDPLYSGGHYLDWLFRLADRLVSRVLTDLDRLNDGGTGVMLLDYHGLQRATIGSELNDFLRSISRDYQKRKSNVNSIAPISPIEPQATDSINSPAAKRLSSQIYSPSAAEKMSAYMNRKGLNQTEFSIQAGTSDKTIRKFIKTGYIKRSILTGIAKAMKISREDLLS